MSNRWGFLRETRQAAQNAGIDQDTGLHRTGLDEYLEIIFPHVNDWIHNRSFDLAEGCRKRPDYRSDTLKLIIEFDGLQHYTSPLRIQKDIESKKFYEGYGYRVIRIPYFIQFTNLVVEQLFGVIVDEGLFDESIPSLGPKGKNTPAFLCIRGIYRMASEFVMFPEQYKVNMDFLKQHSPEEQYLIEFGVLEEQYEKLISNKSDCK
jgi:hypothetical protein